MSAGFHKLGVENVPEKITAKLHPACLFVFLSFPLALTLYCYVNYLYTLNFPCHISVPD